MNNTQSKAGEGSASPPQETRTRRRPGRPRKGDSPRVPHDEVDRLLVHGERGDDGEVIYPTYRELAERYDVSHTLIARYARKHRCLRRRAQVAAKTVELADGDLVDLRADAVALSADDEIRIVDSYLAGFAGALAEGRVRCDSPSEFNTMVRLKEFIRGGPDSRQEIHASLDDVRARHDRARRAESESSAAERGMAAGLDVIDGDVTGETRGLDVLDEDVTGETADLDVIDEGVTGETAVVVGDERRV